MGEPEWHEKLAAGIAEIAFPAVVGNPSLVHPEATEAVPGQRLVFFFRQNHEKQFRGAAAGEGDVQCSRRIDYPTREIGRQSGSGRRRIWMSLGGEVWHGYKLILNS